MKIIIFSISVIIIILMSFVTSCVNYPMGLSEQEWNLLNPEQKVELRQKQAVIDEARRRQQMQAQMEEQKLALQQQEFARQRYSRALYGDIVTVSVQSGTFQFAGKWYPFDPVIFDLIRGESKIVELANTNKQHSLRESISIRFSDDGNQLFFYDDIFGNPTSIINDGSWKVGHRYGPLDLNNGSQNTGVRGAIVQVWFKPLPVPMQKIIIEQR